jgi:hypothetical protein
MAGPGAAANDPAAKAPAKGVVVWIQGLACGALLTFAFPGVLLLGVLMAPSLVCLLIDRAPGHGLARAVGLACAAAALGPAWHLLLAGDTMATAAASLLDPLVLGLAWGAGASAWALCQVLPVVLKAVSDMRESARARAIEAEMASCRAEWDLEG